MFWYLFNIALLSLVYLWPVRDTGPEGEHLGMPKVRRKAVCIVGTVNWIILSGFRHISVGADTLNYKIGRFDKTIDVSWSTLFEDLYKKYILGQEIKDPGYSIFEKFVQIFSKDYQFFLVVIACLFFISLGVLLYKYSRNPYVSFVLFSVLFYSFFAITGHRQTIATALVVLIGTHLIRKKKLIPFLLLTLLASTIHGSAICFIPMYFLSKIKINKYTLAIYWVGIGASFIFRYQLLNLLQALAGYEGYGDHEGAAAGTFLYMLLAVAAVITLFNKSIEKSDNPLLQFATNAVFMACIFAPLLLINPAFMRVVQYYSLFLLVMIPELEIIFPKKNDKLIFKLACVGLLVALFLRNDLTYLFFWQKA